MSATLVKIDKKKLLLVMANNIMSFPDLGEKANVNPRTLYGLKAGKPVTIKTIGKIAKALNVTVENIIDVSELEKSKGWKYDKIRGKKQKNLHDCWP